MSDDLDTAPQSLREWATPRVLRRLEQGWTRPDIADELAGDCPVRYAQQAIRPHLLTVARAIGNAAGYHVIAAGVNEPAESQQIELISLDSVLLLCLKKYKQGEHMIAAAERNAEEWCDAHPEVDITPAQIMAQVRDLAA
jgi:hypothetical protein